MSALLMAAAVLLGVAAFGVARSLTTPTASALAVGPSNLVGKVFSENMMVVDAGGDRIPLLNTVRGKPSLVYVLGRENCLDCSQVPTEMRILRRKQPHLNHVFVGVGPDTAFMRAYARTERILDGFYMDPDGELLRALGVSAPPITLLVDGAGRVLVVDTRAAGEFSRFGVSRVIEALAEVLSAGSSTDPRGPAPHPPERWSREGA